MRIALLSLLFVTSCSGAQVKQRADGTYLVDCSDRKACLDRAERICGNQGFTVVGGKSNKKLYGVPGNSKLVGKDEIYVRCDKDRPLDTPDPTAGSWKLDKRSSDGEAAPSASVSPTAPEVVPAKAVDATPAKTPISALCRPGETQRCVGPGACDGGQACLPDGSGFGACDCGGK